MYTWVVLGKDDAAAVTMDKADGCDFNVVFFFAFGSLHMEFYILYVYKNYYAKKIDGV